MVRQILVASGMLVTLVAFPMAPQAAADSAQTVLIQSGAVRCSVSANDVPRGGGPMVVCQQTNGQPWGTAPYAQEKDSVMLNLAVVHDNGQFYWDKGSVPAGNDVTVGSGDTYRANGWTITGEGVRTRITYDATEHGMFVNVADVRQF